MIVKNNFNFRNIAIIPARAGSKRLPGKNKLLLGGIPLVVHSIRYAKLYNNLIDKIIVSTNDADIKAIALSEGVEVIDRPPEIAGDEATTLSALQHVLVNIKEDVENVFLLQPTNPLRPDNLLENAFKEFSKGKYESLITVSRSYQKFGKIRNNQFIPFNYKMGQRSQDLEPFYFENGLLYIIKASLIRQDKLLGENNFPFIVDHLFSNVDIDEKEDFEYAEFLLNRTEN
ncbi:cytidylyltransferase domain-containing protein [Salegentibacter sp. Hel_I_6]|uniref:acylneuraminate cytidylyltransferase family protein n=1 Tax=Salegentibacter sp. Hel_I_6 TaxID=1250278 RepID=UPI00056B3899|nr:acylneuraminate cytidylyltransferase family protein [Salegentibacter sp. Hel_I_6]